MAPLIQSVTSMSRLPIRSIRQLPQGLGFQKHVYGYHEDLYAHENHPFGIFSEKDTEIFPPHMLGGGYMSYIQGKISQNICDRLRNDGALIYQGLISPVNMGRRLVDKDTFMPMISENSGGLDITSVNGHDILIHLFLMLHLMGVPEDKVVIRPSQFSLDSLFYDRLGMRQDETFNTLTIGTPDMLKPLWESKSKDRAAQALYLREYLAQEIIKFQQRINSTRIKSKKDEDFVKLMAEKKQVLHTVNERLNDPVDVADIDSVVTQLAGNMMMPKQELMPIGMFPEDILTTGLMSHLKGQHRLVNDKRLFGFKWADDNGTHLFLNVHMFYGEMSSLAADFLVQRHAVKRVNLFGTTGGLISGIKPGSTIVPFSFIMNDEEIKVNDLSANRIPGAFSGVQMNVPSPLVETVKTLEHLERYGDSVDCEGGYLALYKKYHPEVDVRMAFRVSDNPMYHAFTGEVGAYNYKDILRAFGLLGN